jgi:hypothetical protein
LFTRKQGASSLSIVQPGASSQIAQPLPENQPLGDSGSLLIIKLAAACHSVNNTSSHTSSLVRSVLQDLTYGKVFIPGSVDSSSLETLRQNCLQSERLDASAGLIHILALMRYRIQIERYFIVFIYIQN